MQLSAQKGGIEASRCDAAGRPLAMFSIITDELEQVRALFERELSDCNEQVQELVACISAGRGKMIRAGLVLLSGLACGGTTEKHVRAAAIVEMIHEATLLHDDVVDESKSRRGIPTPNCLHGNESAVLLGDFLLGRMFRLCAGLDTKAAETIASAAVRTCEGELRQIVQGGNWRLSEPEYIEIIAEKTAALFSGASMLGAMLTGAGEQQVKMLADYGYNVGIAFQITDDLLDLTGDQTSTGKPIGNDIEHSKPTLPLIHFFNSAGEKEKAAVIRRINRRQTNEKRARATLAKMLREHNSIEYARRRAEEFVKQAIASLAGLKNSDGKDALIETARFIAGRTV